MGRVSYEIDGYSHGNNPIPAVARIANTVMTGGISGIDLASGKLPSTIEEQCDNLFEVAAKCLEPAVATLGDVLKVTVFLSPTSIGAPEQSLAEAFSGRAFAGQRATSWSIRISLLVC